MLELLPQITNSEANSLLVVIFIIQAIMNVIVFISFYVYWKAFLYTARKIEKQNIFIASQLSTVNRGITNAVDKKVMDIH